MVVKRQSDIKRLFSYSWEYYKNKLNYIIAFSIPLFVAWIILIAVQAPTYTAVGAPHLRTGSIPDLTENPFDILIIIIGYVLAAVIVAETIVNLNLLIKSKRMLTNPSTEIRAGLGKYAFSITAFLVVLFLISAVAQLLTFERFGQSVVYPFIVFVSSFFLFFTIPAIVIDDEDMFSAIRHSIDLAKRKPMLIFSWVVFATILLTFLGLIFVQSNIIPEPFSSFIFIALHVLFISPFLLILQTQMYVEKYPLAK